jgi:O-6-methylguanine DNA methyltransferase
MSPAKAVYFWTWSTDLGHVAAVATERGLAGLHLHDFDPVGEADRLAGRGAWELREEQVPVLAATQAQLGEYLAGRRREFDLLLDLKGTTFQLEVWAALRRIPFGRVVTYGQLAAMVGRLGAARAVGQANGANPVAVIVPCHRVVASGGLGGYGGGLARKRLLLGLEGITEAHLRRAGQAALPGRS